MSGRDPCIRRYCSLAQMVASQLVLDAGVFAVVRGLLESTQGFDHAEVVHEQHLKCVGERVGNACAVLVYGEEQLGVRLDRKFC